MSSLAENVTLLYHHGNNDTWNLYPKLIYKRSCIFNIAHGTTQVLQIDDNAPLKLVTQGLPPATSQGQVLTVGDNATLALRSKVNLNLPICSNTGHEVVCGCDSNRVEGVLT